MVGSTLQAFARGDVFVGATVLNDPADDHAGRGRIIQYDADLVEKGVLWLEQTTHLVGGLKFVEEPKMLRFFFGKLATTTDWQAKLLAKFKADLGSNL